VERATERNKQVAAINILKPPAIFACPVQILAFSGVTWRSAIG
jgi:hypothetical protein